VGEVVEQELAVQILVLVAVREVLELEQVYQ
jgi:hypothetical protein